MIEKRILAYLDPLSVEAGEELKVMVSCEAAGSFEAQLVRLISGDSRAHGTGFREEALNATFNGLHPGRKQALQPGSWAHLPGLPALDGFTVALMVWPTLPGDDGRTLISTPGFSIAQDGGRLHARLGEDGVASSIPLRERRWHQVVVSFDGERLRMTLRVRPRGAGERSHAGDSATAARGVPLAAGSWYLAAAATRDGPAPGFNGRLEAPRVWSTALEPEEALHALEERAPRHPGLEGAWDFALEISSDRICDVSVHARHGSLHQTPTRAVGGHCWDGSVQRWQSEPAHYAAIHFHDDDLTDAGWSPDLRWTVPEDLPSGAYAVRLRLGDSEDYAPFFVRPGKGQARKEVVYLASTATYIAYANQRLGFTGGIFGDPKPKNPNDAYLLQHEEVGYSLYEYHRDGSGVHYSSRLRPVLNMKPHNVPWALTADTNITAWLEAMGQPFDVITDEDLHREGEAALDGHRVVITGTHPEYYSAEMLGALDGWLEKSGRLMYMGGNGFYWRIAHHPANPAIIEVRRAEGGTRAWMSEPGEYYHSFTGEYGGLWRRNDRPPNQLVGVGFAAQGFDGGTHYRLQDDALDARAGFIMEGVKASEIIGDYGTQGGGAAGEEIDRFDLHLGSPGHALVLATSENHGPGMLRTVEEFHMTQPHGGDPNVRADMTFFETPSGGAVFSTGSISYAGSLSTNGYDNDIARMTTNVLRRFADPKLFEYPGESSEGDALHKK